MTRKLSELDKLNNKALAYRDKLRYHKNEIDKLSVKIDQLQEQIKELTKPGFKIPTKK